MFEKRKRSTDFKILFRACLPPSFGSTTAHHSQLRGYKNNGVRKAWGEKGAGAGPGQRGSMEKCGTSLKVSAMKKIKTNKNTKTIKRRCLNPRNHQHFRSMRYFNTFLYYSTLSVKRKEKKEKEKRCKRTALRRHVSRKSQSSDL